MSRTENIQKGKRAETSVDYKIDARQMPCPLPLLKMKQALNKAQSGEVVMVLATDPTSVRDFKAFIDMTSHSLLMKVHANEFHYWITKQ